MITAKVTSKGQITLPKKVRDDLGVLPGETVGFEERDGIFLIKKAVRKSPFDKWAGVLKGKGKSADEIIEDLRGE